MTPSEKEAVAYIRKRFGAVTTEDRMLVIWGKEIEIFCAGRQAALKQVEKEIGKMAASEKYYGIGDGLDRIRQMRGSDGVSE